MFMQKDNTYNELRERSFLGWLDEMEKHEDMSVSGGVRLAREYMHYLKEENRKLQEEKDLALQYLKKKTRG